MISNTEKRPLRFLSFNVCVVDIFDYALSYLRILLPPFYISPSTQLLFPSSHVLKSFHFYPSRFLFFAWCPPCHRCAYYFPLRECAPPLFAYSPFPFLWTFFTYTESLQRSTHTFYFFLKKRPDRQTARGRKKEGKKTHTRPLRRGAVKGKGN